MKFKNFVKIYKIEALHSWIVALSSNYLYFSNFQLIKREFLSNRFETN